MSDVLLTEISKKLSDIHAALKGGAANGGAKTPASTAPAAPKADANAIAGDTTKTPAEKAAAANKAIAERKAAKALAEKTATAKAPAKAPGGKHTLDQVREIIRKVAADVDKVSAKNILADDGGGAERCDVLKPEFYDAVYEACEVLLGGEGAPKAAPDELDDL